MLAGRHRHVGALAIAATLLLAGSAHADPLDTVTVGAGAGGGAVVEGTYTLAANTEYTLVATGSLSKTFTLFNPDITIGHDAFYCTSASDGTSCPAQVNPTELLYVRTTGDPTQQMALGAPTLGSRVSPAHVAPPYEADHEYSFTVSFPHPGRLRFGTTPQCTVGQTFCSGAGYTLRLYAKEAAPTTPPVTPTPPATTPPTETTTEPELTATVESIRGEVIYRLDAGPWMAIAPGAKVPANAELFTGVESGVTVRFNDGSSFEIDELTQLIVDTILRKENRKAVAINLVVGKIKAKVQKEKVLDTNWEIQTPTATTSVRGTVFSVFYDPGAAATVVSTSEGLVEVDPVRAGLATAFVAAGREVEVTRSAISKVTTTGKAGARGGVNRIQALDLVLARIARNAKRCKLTTPRSPKPFGVATARGGWVVTVRVAGKARGTSTWNVSGRKVRAKNAVARRISRGCR
ncbi:MAG: FecR domain-containing protein [Solirubrobacteraceae bacterium]|nr:FecR domain-containing protein [Solirubrobacteraceae bacterium]